MFTARNEQSHNQMQLHLRNTSDEPYASSEHEHGTQNSLDLIYSHDDNTVFPAVTFFDSESISDEKQIFQRTCGGAYIAPNVVITSAKCFDLIDIAVIGPMSYPFDFSARHYKQFEVVKRLIHPNFDPITLDYDFMLVHLKSIASEETSDVANVSWQAPYFEALSFDNGRITLDGRPYHAVWNNVKDKEGQVSESSSSSILFELGWGTSPTSKAFSATPMIHVQKSTCNELHSHGSYKLTSRMLCAMNSPEASKDSVSRTGCVEVGGPLVRVSSFDEVEVVGIASWGNDCSDLSTASVYSRVGRVTNWVEGTLSSWDVIKASKSSKSSKSTNRSKSSKNSKFSKTSKSSKSSKSSKTSKSSKSSNSSNSGTSSKSSKSSNSSASSNSSKSTKSSKSSKSTNFPSSSPTDSGLTSNSTTFPSVLNMESSSPSTSPTSGEVESTQPSSSPTTGSGTKPPISLPSTTPSTTPSMINTSTLTSLEPSQLPTSFSHVPSSNPSVSELPTLSNSPSNNPSLSHLPSASLSPSTGPSISLSPSFNPTNNSAIFRVYDTNEVIFGSVVSVVFLLGLFTYAKKLRIKS